MPTTSLAPNLDLGAVAKNVGSLAGALALLWNIFQAWYKANTRVTVRIRTANGSLVADVDNNSPENSISVQKFVVRYRKGMFSWDQISASAWVQGGLPVPIQRKDLKSLAVPLARIDGRAIGASEPGSRDFKKKVKVQLTLARGKKVTSRSRQLMKEDGSFDED